jgi:hypothetical protein
MGWRALAVCLGVGTGGLAYYALEKQRRMGGVSRRMRAAAPATRA